MMKQGSYTDGLDALIETTAGNIYAYHLALRDVESLEVSYLTELTREGNEKLTPHPAIKTVREQSEMIRRQLRELRLTIATLEGGNDDEMGDMMNSINNVK